jgi:hypothetical protein
MKKLSFSLVMLSILSSSAFAGITCTSTGTPTRAETAGIEMVQESQGDGHFRMTSINNGMEIELQASLKDKYAFVKIYDPITKTISRSGVTVLSPRVNNFIGELEIVKPQGSCEQLFCNRGVTVICRLN